MAVSNFSNQKAFCAAVSNTALALGLAWNIAGLVACSSDAETQRPPTSETQGTRSYKLDPGSAAVQLSIYGTAMGTPDTSKFSYLMKTFKNAGELVSVTEKDSGIEGGITICGVFSASANRDAVYHVLRSTETDSKSTNFSATSVSSCNN